MEYASSATEAYRLAYDASGMRSATVNRMAKDVMDNHKIAARIDELRAPAIEKAKKEFGYNLESLLDELDLARSRALSASPIQASAAISATLGKARLLGFLTSKIEVSASSSIGSLIREIEVKTVECD